MSDTAVLTHGDSFNATAFYRDANNNLVNLTTAGIDVSARAIRHDGSSEADIDVQISNQNLNIGQFLLKSDTATWGPTGKYRIIVTYEQGEIRFSADPFYVDLR